MMNKPKSNRMKLPQSVLIILLFFTAVPQLTGQVGNDTIIPNDLTAAPGFTSRDQSDGKPTPAAAASISGANVEEAAQAYRDQDYGKSILLYEELVLQGFNENKESAQIYFNLGNAYFRNNQLGKAILNYERALLLDPGDGDIRHNLRFAKNRTEDRIDTAGDLFIANWFLAVRNIYSSDQWAIIGIVFFMLFLFSAGTFLFVRILWVKKSAFYAGIIFFSLMITSNIFAFSQKSGRIHRDAAIVMVGAARVNASPDENSNTLFELHEGTRVKVRSSDGNWFEIEITNGSVGWTSKKNVEII